MEEDLRIRYEAILEINGVKVIDKLVADLLRKIKEKGSILAASRSLGIPYSRAWEIIVRIERLTGKQIIETSRGGRGGGGTRLTSYGSRLLELYSRAEEKLYRLAPSQSMRFVSIEEPDVIVAYSHDPLLEFILGDLERNNYRVEGLCIGSSKALATLALEESDIACIHLYDPVTKTYNKPYIEKQWFSQEVVYLGGYLRELVFAIHPNIKISNIDQILEKIISGELRIACRNKGSGTRNYLDYLINDYIGKHGIESINIVGCEKELYTHTEVVKKITSGKADVGLTIKHLAVSYGLKTIHVTWERYECITLKEKLGKKPVIVFKELLDKKYLSKYIQELTGYRLD